MNSKCGITPPEAEPQDYASTWRRVTTDLIDHAMSRRNMVVVPVN